MDGLLPFRQTLSEELLTGNLFSHRLELLDFPGEGSFLASPTDGQLPQTGDQSLEQSVPITDSEQQVVHRRTTARAMPTLYSRTFDVLTRY